MAFVLYSYSDAEVPTHSLTKLTIFKIWQEDFEVGRKILRKCIKRIKLATNCVSQAASNTIYT